MAKSGLLTELLILTDNDCQAENDIYKSKEVETYDGTASLTVACLKRYAQTKEPEIILEGERIRLEHELNTTANSKAETRSYEEALSHLQSAKECLKIVREPSRYRDANKTYYKDRDPAKLPEDSFRKFIDGHRRRLNNMKWYCKVTSKEKIFSQRLRNLEVAKKAYIELQRKALGMNKEQGLER